MSENYQKMREACGLTLQQAAKHSGYSVGTINGLELRGAGSQRLRHKLREVYGDVVSTPLKAAVALAGSSGGTPGDQQAVFERAAAVLVKDRAATKKLSRLRSLLVQMIEVIDQDDAAAFPSKKNKKNLRVEVASNQRGRKEKRTRLRDIDSVSLAILGNIPAGWPQANEESQATVRVVRVRRGRFPEGAFGLYVRGDSMNLARPEPILDGETVVLVSPEQREPRSGDIVAALIDGETTLKRLMNGDRPAHLVSESSNPAFGKIYPARELTIQGVCIGKI